MNLLCTTFFYVCFKDENRFNFFKNKFIVDVGNGITYSSYVYHNVEFMAEPPQAEKCQPGPALPPLAEQSRIRCASGFRRHGRRSRKRTDPHRRTMPPPMPPRCGHGPKGRIVSAKRSTLRDCAAQRAIKPRTDSS